MGAVVVTGKDLKIFPISLHLALNAIYFYRKDDGINKPIIL